ncbi:hypothetical protein DFH06DRAFT_991761, partial [Mycena polygramma]
YSITKPFPKTYSYFLLVFGILSAGFFAVTNVFLAGYDVISITATPLNFTPGSRLPMWQWRAGSNPFGCRPYQFQLGDTFRTNISAFSYSIFDVRNPTSGSGNATIEGGFSYANQELSSCDVEQYQISVKPGDRLIACSVSIHCPPLGFRAVTSWSYSNHVLVGSLPAGMFPPNSLARAINDGMRNISGEAYMDIYNKLYVTLTDPPQYVYKVIAAGPICDTPSACAIPTFSTYNAIGNSDLNVSPTPSSIAADVGNLLNVITVFYAAVRLDLGHWTGDNVFTNTTSFKQLIRNTDGVNTIFRQVATSKGMAYANLPAPLSVNVSTSPAVIQIPYTCNITQRKPIGSFIVSVISATLSMFLGTWGAVGAILSIIVRRNPRGECQAGPTCWDVDICFQPMSVSIDRNQTKRTIRNTVHTS